MTDTPTANWPGASGKTYTYYIYNLDFNPNQGQDGNYIFARQTRRGWEAVYIGQGDLRDRKDDAEAEGCVTSKGATHFHCHKNGDKDSRRAEEVDVLGGNPEAYVPTGCNEKAGG